MSTPVRFVPHSLLQLANRASLRAALSTSYLLQIAIVIGLSAGLAWRTIDRTGIYLTRQQQAAIAQRLGDRLRDDHQQMQELEQAAIDGLSLNMLSQPEAIERWLWQQIRSRDATAIGLRDAQGRSFAILQEPDGSLIGVDRPRDTAPTVYRLDDKGQRLDAINVTDTRPLVRFAALFNPDDDIVGIIRLPLPNTTATMPPLLVATLPQIQLQALLDQLYLGSRGVAAVLDRQGQLIASSLQTLNPETPATADVADPDVAALLEQIIVPLGDPIEPSTSPERPQEYATRWKGQRYQVSISALEVSPEDWVWVVSAIADHDFGPVGYRDVVNFVAMSVLAAAVVGGVNLLKVRTTIRAIRQLKQAIEALGQQRWSLTRLQDRPPEFRQVNASVTQAARRLQTDFQQLRSRNAELEEIDQFRTALFNDSMRQLSPWLQAIVAGEATDSPSLIKTAKQTLNLLENAVALSQLQAEQLDLNLEPVMLDRCLDPAIAQQREEMTAQQIQLQYDDDASTVRVAADPLRLQRVFCELLENAVQFSDRGGVIRVSIDLTLSGVRSTYHDLPEVSVTITDFGLGIDPSEQHKLFQPFTRISRHHPDRCGYGLGLAIAHQMISMMGGRLTVHSSGLNQGTTARVTLPVLSPNASSQPVDWDAITDLPALRDRPNTPIS